jgi:hypothetical protein
MTCSLHHVSAATLPLRLVKLDKENNYCNHLIPQKHPVVIIYKDFEDAEDNSGT